MIDPISRFGELLQKARSTDLPEPTAMVLATADSRGRPSARMVLLKEFDARGFVFYTNLGSRKAEELAQNPHAALCFHWQPLEQQVRIEGTVAPVTAEEADAYFASRARGSQIGAWASMQSRELASHSQLEQRVDELQSQFGNAPISRPEYWSGFRVAPDYIEFWSARPSRLHERETYTRDRETGGWIIRHLYP